MRGTTSCALQRLAAFQEHASSRCHPDRRVQLVRCDPSLRLATTHSCHPLATKGSSTNSMGIGGRFRVVDQVLAPSLWQARLNGTCRAVLRRNRDTYMAIVGATAQVPELHKRGVGRQAQAQARVQ